MDKKVTKIDTKTLKGIFLVASILLGFAFLVLFATLYVSEAIKNNNACGCVIPIPYMILLLSTLGLFVGCLAFYLLMARVLKERKASRLLFDTTLKFLDPDDRKVMSVLYDHDGRFSQARFEKSTGLHKVKVHRVIERLEQKGLIVKKSAGNSNIIVLSSDLQELYDSSHTNSQ